MSQERTKRLGNVVLHLVSDGICWMDGGGIFGIVPKPLWQRLTEVDDQNRVPMELNCLLIETCDEVILVDTGFGTKMPSKQREFYRTPDSRLLANLAELGYAPEDIHFVINTHLHPDHCGGNTRMENGVAVPSFPNAVYVVQEQEWHDATHPNERTRAVYLPENMLPLQKSDQLRLIRGEAQITDEIRCLPTPGHTFGHQSVVIQSDGETAIYVGDMAHWAVNMERLPWTTAFEVQPLQTMEIKQAIQKWALARNALLIFGHDPRTFWGHLFEAEETVRVTPV
jgi:glyoxylase-like metal-dependent hydrolase (beta-lactamase superfamily II)